jgi:hypothetical protein
MLAAAVALGLAPAAHGSAWPMFGGGPGRSSFASAEPAPSRLVSAWSATAPSDEGVWTTPVITAGARPLVVYATQKPTWLDGPTSTGQVHIRDLLNGAPVGPVAGTSIDDPPGDADTLGSGNKASVSFADSSLPGGPPGQVFVVYNDDDSAGTGNDVAIAQIDLATGDLVQDVPVPDTPHTRPGSGPGDNGTDISSGPLLELDAAGDGILVFRTGQPIYSTDPLTPGQIVDRVERVHVVPIANARSRGAHIDTAAARATPGVYATTRTTPALVTLADPDAGGAPARYVAIGTSKPSGAQEVRTFKLPTLEPGPSATGLAGWVQTVSAPPVDGPAPYLVVATGKSGGTSRAYRLVQEGSRLVVDRMVQLPGEASPALATDGRRVVATTDANLYVLRASDLSVVARFSPSDLRRGCAPCAAGATPPASSQTGFLVGSPVLAPGRIYVERDDGAQLVLDAATAQPVAPGAFTQDPANAGSAFTRGQPAVGDGHVVFAGHRGVFVYRSADLPVPPADPAGVLGATVAPPAAAVAPVAPRTSPRPPAATRATTAGLRRTVRPLVSLRTRRSGSRTKVVRLLVTARRGWRLTARCRGRGCPTGAVRRRIHSGRPQRLARLERRLGAGATIEVQVTRAGAVGTAVRFVVRGTGRPSRRELCLAPGGRTPSRCAS